ncbi:MAG TPA: galactokinase [Galbitalea sp.]|nr:galactokinase [Galbitalea sp.]
MGQRTAVSFASTFGSEADGLWSAPGRVNLIGEHTDYNLGFVLPFAIDRRTVAALRLRDDRLARVASSFSGEIIELDLDDLRPERLSGWSAYPFGTAWALGWAGLGANAADLTTAQGFEVFIESDVPVGAGLSSSAAIESSIAIALNDCWELRLGPPALARAGQLAENTVIGAPTGIMDQSASLMGRANSALFLDCRGLESRIIELGFDRAGLAVLVIDTGIRHAHATGGYADRRAACELGGRLLGVSSLRDLTVDDLPRASEKLDDVTFRRVRHVVTENQRVLQTVATLETEGPAAIGDILDASHRSLRDDFEVSIPEIDLAVETARANGAIGARITGGGFGGAAIALIARHEVDPARTAIDEAFVKVGLGRPEMFVVTPSDGAKRDS